MRIAGPQPTCKNCGKIVRQYATGWVHEGSRQKQCDLPQPVATPNR